MVPEGFTSLAPSAGLVPKVAEGSDTDRNLKSKQKSERNHFANLRARPYTAAESAHATEIKAQIRKLRTSDWTPRNGMYVRACVCAIRVNILLRVRCAGQVLSSPDSLLYIAKTLSLSPILAKWRQICTPDNCSTDTWYLYTLY